MANGRRTGKACQAEKQGKSLGCRGSSKSDGSPKSKKQQQLKPAKKPASPSGVTAAKAKVKMATGRRARRTPAEMYKSRHNIGNRSAAERVRVGSYKESEIALYFPDAYWPAVKVDFHTSPTRTHEQTDEEESDKQEKSSLDACKGKAGSDSRERKKIVSKDDKQESTSTKKKDLTETDAPQEKEPHGGGVRVERPQGGKKAASPVKKDGKASSSKKAEQTASRTSPKKEPKAQASKSEQVKSSTKETKSEQARASAKETKSEQAKASAKDTNSEHAKASAKETKSEQAKASAKEAKAASGKASNPDAKKSGKPAAKQTVSSDARPKTSTSSKGKHSEKGKVPAMAAAKVSKQDKAKGARSVTSKSKASTANSSSSSLETSGSKANQSLKYAHVKPRPLRIKRTACLNAGLITSLMLESEEPASKRKKIEAPAAAAPAGRMDSDDDSDADSEIIIMKVEARSLDFTQKKRENGPVSQAVKKKRKEADNGKDKMTRKGKAPAAKKKSRAKLKVNVDRGVKRKQEVPDIPLWPPPKRMASLNAQAILAACSEEWPSTKRQRQPSDVKPKSETATDDPPLKKVDSPQKRRSLSVEKALEKPARCSPTKGPSPVKESKEPTKASQLEKATGKMQAQSPPGVEVPAVKSGASGSTPTAQHLKQQESPCLSLSSSCHPAPVQFTPSSAPPITIHCPVPTPPPSVCSAPCRPTSQPTGSQLPRAPGQPPMQPYPQPYPPGSFHARFPSQYMQAGPYPVHPPQVQPVPSYPPQSSTPQKLPFKPGYEPQCPTTLGGSGSGFQHITKAEKPSSAPNTPWDMNNPSPVKRQHNVAHKSAPMGNTCTYPYPHSNAHNTSSQAYPMGAGTMSMEPTGSYGMVTYPKHYGNAFYNQQQQVPYGYYQPAGPLLQTLSTDPCCMPPAMSMQLPQPQVKVLVHNAGAPANSSNNALPVDMSRAGMRQSSSTYRGVDMSLNSRGSPASMPSSLPPPPGAPMGMHHPRISLQGMHMMPAHIAQPPLDFSRCSAVSSGRRSGHALPPSHLHGARLGTVTVTSTATASTQLNTPMPIAAQAHPQPAASSKGLRVPVQPICGSASHSTSSRNIRSERPGQRAEGEGSQKKSKQTSESDYVILNLDNIKKDKSPGSRDSVQPAIPFSPALLADMGSRQLAPQPKLDRLSPASAPELSRPVTDNAWNPSNPRAGRGSKQEAKKQDRIEKSKRTAKADSKTPRKDQKVSITKPSMAHLGAAGVPVISAKNFCGDVMPSSTAVVVPLPVAANSGHGHLLQPALQQLKKGTLESELDLSKKSPGVQGLPKGTLLQEEPLRLVLDSSQPTPDNGRAKPAPPTKAKVECSKPKADNPKAGKKESVKRKKEETCTAKQKKDSEFSSGKKRPQSQEANRKPGNTKVPRVEKHPVGGRPSPGGRAPQGGGASGGSKVTSGGKDLVDAKVKAGGKRSPGIKVASPDSKKVAESKPSVWGKMSLGLKAPSEGKGASEGLKALPAEDKMSPTGVKTAPGLKVPFASQTNVAGKGQNGGKISPKVSPTGKALERQLTGSKGQGSSKVSPKSPNGSKVSLGSKASTSSAGKASGSGKGASSGKHVGTCKASPSGKISPSGRKREVVEKPLVCQWHWEGTTRTKLVYVQVDVPPVERLCYAAIKHDDGDIIHERDCVLVKSGPRKRDIPYVAKIAGLWQTEAGEMMMSVLWYYRPEHTETERLPHFTDCEVFASKHCDQIPVACIDDKCHVLTVNEYCRYKSEQKRLQSGYPPRLSIVPPGDLPENHRLLPPLDADPETVFMCRKVYDLKRKRVLKNPQPNMPVSPVSLKTPTTATSVAASASVPASASASTSASASASASVVVAASAAPSSESASAASASVSPKSPTDG